MSKINTWVEDATFRTSNPDSIVWGIGTNDQVALLAGAKDVAINGAEVYHFAGKSTDFQFRNEKGEMQVFSKDGTALIAKFLVTPGTEGETLKFNDGSFTAHKATEGNGVELKGLGDKVQTLTSDQTPAVLTDVTIDPAGKSTEAGTDTPTPPTPGEGNTFTLTTGQDIKTGIHEYTGYYDNTAASTFNGSDDLTGSAAADDILNLTVGGTAATLPPAAVSGVEIISVRNTSTATGAGLTIDGANFIGVKEFVNYRSTGTAGTTFDNIGAADVTIQGNGATVHTNTVIKAGVATTDPFVLNIKDGVKGGDVDAGTGNSWTDVTINSTGAANEVGTVKISATAATSLTIDAATDLITGTISGFSTGAADTITIKGAADKVSIGLLDTAVDVVDASGLVKGGVELTYNTTLTTKVTGGQGDDVINVGSGAITGKIDAGAGDKDVIAFTGTGAGTYATTIANVKNFEVLRVGGSATYDASLLNGVTSVELAGGKASTIVTGLTAATTVTAIGSNASNGKLITLTGKDSLTLNLDNALADTAVILGVDGAGDGLKTTGIKTLTIDSGNALTGVKANTLWIDNGTTDLTAIKVQGDSNLALHDTVKNINVDATGFAKNLDLTFVAADAETHITGGNGTDTFTTTTISDKLHLDGGADNDTLALASNALTLIDTDFHYISGVETLNITQTTAATTSINLGAGFNTSGVTQVNVDITSGDIANTFKVFEDFAGKVDLKLTATTTTADIDLTTGKGDDSIAVSATAQTTGTLTINTGAGDDGITAFVGTDNHSATGTISITGGAGRDVITIHGDTASAKVSAADAHLVTINIGTGEHSIATSDSVTGYVMSADASNKGMILNFDGGAVNAVATGKVGELGITDGKVTFNSALAALSLDDKIKYLDNNMTTDHKVVFFMNGDDAYVFNNNDVDGSSVVELIGVAGAAKLDVLGSTAAADTIIIA